MTHAHIRSLLIEVDVIDGVWIATAPWLTNAVTGPSFEAVYWAAIGMLPR